MRTQLILLGIGAAAIAAAIWYVHDMGYDAGYNKRVVEERIAAEEAALSAGAASSSLEDDRVQVRTVYRTITKEVERVVEKPVYRDVCLDPDGMRVANAALTRAGVAGQSDEGVPEPAAAGERNEGGSAAEAGGGR